LLDVALVEHALPDGRVEFFLHKAEDATTEEVVAKLNEFGRAPPPAHDRYRGTYKAHGTATVEVADWSWIQLFWIEPVPRERLAAEWRSCVCSLRRSVYADLSGWQAAEKSADEVIRTITQN
jgi:hypothetical protein